VRALAVFRGHRAVPVYVFGVATAFLDDKIDHFEFNEY
jgi:hypothetical protein